MIYYKEIGKEQSTIGISFEEQTKLFDFRNFLHPKIKKLLLNPLNLNELLPELDSKKKNKLKNIYSQ